MLSLLLFINSTENIEWTEQKLSTKTAMKRPSCVRSWALDTN